MSKQSTIWFGLALVLLFSFSADAAFAAYFTDSPVVEISKVRQDPSPAVPGEVVELELQVENQGGGDVEDLEVTVLASYPFTIYGDSGATRQVGDLSAYQSDEDSAQISFKLLVDDSATDENNELEIRYTYDSGEAGEWYSTTTIEVPVDNPLTGFEVTGAQVSEDMAELYVVNSGKNTASSILMFVNDERAYSVGDLEAGELASTYVSLPQDFETTSLLTVDFVYTDTASTRRQSTSFARIYPIQASDVELLLRDLSGTTATVAIVNAGNFPLYAVSVRPVGASASATQSIVGNLDAGDYSLATFTISTANTTSTMEKVARL